MAPAAAEEVADACTTATDDVDATAELEANRDDAEPEATGMAAPEVLAATATAAVPVAEDEATPPVPAAARAEDTDVHAGFLERFSSYRQASPWPEKVLGTHEYCIGCQLLF